MAPAYSLLPVCSGTPEPSASANTSGSFFGRASQLTDGLNAHPRSFQLVDFVHAFPPEQVFALLWAPEKGLHHGYTTRLRGWGFFNRLYGDFCTGGDKTGIRRRGGSELVRDEPTPLIRPEALKVHAITHVNALLLRPERPGRHALPGSNAVNALIQHCAKECATRYRPRSFQPRFLQLQIRRCGRN